jgi:predicted nucleic acid-binding protein
MQILVDTPIWSLAFRKAEKTKEQISIINELENLINEFRIAFIGPIRQEILSGISDKNKFESLRQNLQAFDDEIIATKHYEKAAEMMNICRKNGIQGSHIDFLICALAHLNNYAIFTLDKDFENYSKYLDIKLYKIRDKK